MNRVWRRLLLMMICTLFISTRKPLFSESNIYLPHEINPFPPNQQHSFFTKWCRFLFFATNTSHFYTQIEIYTWFISNGSALSVFDLKLHLRALIQFNHAELFILRELLIRICRKCFNKWNGLDFTSNTVSTLNIYSNCKFSH